MAPRRFTRPNGHLLLRATVTTRRQPAQPPRPQPIASVPSQKLVSACGAAIFLCGRQRGAVRTVSVASRNTDLRWEAHRVGSPGARCRQGSARVGLKSRGREGSGHRARLQSCRSRHGGFARGARGHYQPSGVPRKRLAVRAASARTRTRPALGCDRRVSTPAFQPCMGRGCASPPISFEFPAQPLRCRFAS